MRLLILITLLQLPFEIYSQLKVIQEPKFEYKATGVPTLKLLQTDSVKTVKVYKSHSQTKKPSNKRGSLFLEFEFDKKGNCIKTVKFNNKGIANTYQYNYDTELGKLTINKLNRRGKLKNQLIFKNKKLINEIEFYSKEKIKTNTKYAYINDTLLKSYCKINQNEDTISNTIFLYDNLYRVIETKQYENHELTGIRKTTYFENNSIDKIHFFPPEKITVSSIAILKNLTNKENKDISKVDIPFSKVDFLYSENGKTYTIKQYNADSVLEFTTICELNENQKIKKMETFKGVDKIYKQVEFDYSIDGKLYKKTRYLALLKKYFFTKKTDVKYDDNGRIKKINIIDTNNATHFSHSFFYEMH